MQRSDLRRRIRIPSDTNQAIKFVDCSRTDDSSIFFANILDAMFHFANCKCSNKKNKFIKFTFHKNAKTPNVNEAFKTNVAQLNACS